MSLFLGNGSEGEDVLALLLIQTVDEEVDVAATIDVLVVVLSEGLEVLGGSGGDGEHAGEDGAAGDEDIVPVDDVQDSLAEDSPVALELGLGGDGEGTGLATLVEREGDGDLVVEAGLVLGLEGVLVAKGGDHEEVLVLEVVGVLQGILLGVETAVHVLFVEDGLAELLVLLLGAAGLVLLEVLLDGDLGLEILKLGLDFDVGDVNAQLLHPLGRAGHGRDAGGCQLHVAVVGEGLLGFIHDNSSWLHDER